MPLHAILPSAVYAAGNNSHYQLDFDADGDERPKDCHTFQKLCQGDAVPTIVNRSSYTYVDFDGDERLAGVGEEETLDVSAFSDSCVNGRGEVLWTPPCLSANGRSSKILKYRNQAAVQEGKPDLELELDSPVQMVDSWAAGWVILLEDGSVATMGDGRFSPCLGRDIDLDRPAAKPAPVYDLDNTGPWLSGYIRNDPITFVAAGGYTCGAITESGALYVWGMKPPGPYPKKPGMFPGISSQPMYVALNGDADVDIAEVAFGDEHAIAMDIDSNVYVIGNNADGQLGLGQAGPRPGPDGRAFAYEWTKVPLPDLPDKHVGHVAAGPKASFIILVKRDQVYHWDWSADDEIAEADTQCKLLWAENKVLREQKALQQAEIDVLRQKIDTVSEANRVAGIYKEEDAKHNETTSQCEVIGQDESTYQREGIGQEVIDRNEDTYQHMDIDKQDNGQCEVNVDGAIVQDNGQCEVKVDGTIVQDKDIRQQLVKKLAKRQQRRRRSSRTRGGRISAVQG